MRGLPKIKIGFANGANASVVSSADGLLLLCVCGAVAVDSTFALAKPYSLRKADDLAPLGITEANNALLHNTVKHFYNEAPDGTQVYIIGYPATLKMSDVLNKANPYLRTTIEALNGELRGIVVTKTQASGTTIANGLDGDIAPAMLNAQALGEWATTQKFAPLFTLIDGVAFNGNATDLRDLKTLAYNRVGVVIGSEDKGAVNQSVGLVAGRIASAQVSVNIGRVRNRALNVLTMYAGANAIEVADVESIYERGYITFRTFTGKSGYYIADDQQATAETDDYRHLTARRSIDKAYRLAYTTLVDQVLDTLLLTGEGTLQHTTAVAIEEEIKNTIRRNMTGKGELSDDGDGGVQFVIDRRHNVRSTGEVLFELRIHPLGYARYIGGNMGFTINR